MTHWTVHDRRAAEMVAAVGGPGAEITTTPLSSAQALELALACPPSVALLPSSVPGQTCIIQITRPRLAAQPSPERAELAGASYVAAGFLGLADEVVLESEPEKPRKWWQKLLD